MIPKHIFREYDIRGLAEKELTDETARLIGQAFGSFLLEEKGKSNRRIKVAVARDLRPSSERLQKALVEGLNSAGVDVLDLGLVPTPLLYFGVVHFQQDAGISVTGSHNPPEYNGFKFQLAKRPFYGDDIRQLEERIERIEIERIEKEAKRRGKGESGEEEKEKGPKREEEAEGEKTKGEGREEAGQGEVQSTDIISPYLAALKAQFRYSKKWKVAIDSGHGMAGLVAPRLFRELGQDVTELYSNLDPTFPDHHPDPSVPENMKDLSQAVKSEKAALGIAFDGDMDRVGVVDEKGRIIPNDILLMLYARQVLKQNPGAVIVGDVKCSPFIFTDMGRRGAGQVLMWKTGHSLIKAKMKETKAALGGEFSGHMFFADRWYGFDDALYAACRILEILDQEKSPLSELYGDVPQMVSTPEIRMECSSDQKKFEIIQAIVSDLKKAYPNVIDIDGARVSFEDGSWALIRASNTQPVLVMRFEARSEKRLAEIRSLIEGKIKKYV